MDLIEEESSHEVGPTKEDLDKAEEVIEYFNLKFPVMDLDEQAIAEAIARTGKGKNPFL